MPAEKAMWLNRMMQDMEKEADSICKRLGVDKEVVRELATTMTFEEFNEALDNIIKSKKNKA